MSRTQWQKCFDDAAVEGNLKCPGVAGLFVLCESNGMNSIALADIENFFEKQEMPTDSDLGCSDLFALLERLGPCPCGKARPLKQKKYSVSMLPLWTCVTCKEKG